MATPKLPLNGSNAPIIVYLGGAPLPQMDLAMSWDLSEDATIYNDKYLGRNRDRKDKKTYGYKLRLDLHYADKTLVQALTDIEAAREANASIPELSVGIINSERDGSFHGFIVQKCVGTFTLASRGKDERLTLSVDLQGEDLQIKTL